MNKEFIYSVIADDFEKSGTIFKPQIEDVEAEIKKLLSDKKYKKLKVEINEKEDERDS